MLPTNDMLTGLVDILTAKTNHPQHINAERIADDLALVHGVLQPETQIGVTPADRRAVAEALQRLNTLVFDSPDAPVLTAYPATELTLEHSMAYFAEQVGLRLEGEDNAPRKA